MHEPNFFQRIGLAFLAFFAILFNRSWAIDVAKLRQAHKSALPPKPEQAVSIAPKADGAALRPDALHLLAILQRDGRFLDFLQEDVGAYEDAEVGAAARAVHQGCRKALGDYIKLEPVLSQPEGASVTLGEDFDPAKVRLTGNVVGKPPFRGNLRHHGWRAAEVKLPNSPAGDPTILAPAEVELS